MATHEVTVSADWCNDDSADLSIWCETCDREIFKFNSREHGPVSFSTMATMVSTHQDDPRTEIVRIVPEGILLRVPAGVPWPAARIRKPR